MKVKFNSVLLHIYLICIIKVSPPSDIFKQSVIILMGTNCIIIYSIVTSLHMKTIAKFCEKAVPKTFYHTHIHTSYHNAISD